MTLDSGLDVGVTLDIFQSLHSNLEIVEKFQLNMSKNFLTTELSEHTLHASVSVLSLGMVLCKSRTPGSLVQVTCEKLGPCPRGNPTGMSLPTREAEESGCLCLDAYPGVWDKASLSFMGLLPFTGAGRPLCLMSK